MAENANDQMIGTASPQLERVAAERQGWTDQDRSESLGTEVTDASDFSFRDRRANRQELGLEIPNMAGHTETPIAALNPTPTAEV